jgi:hypothetical protein
LADLGGGRVSTGAPGAAAEITAPIVFRTLDIPVRTVAIDHTTGCAALAEGTLDAIIHVGAFAPCADTPPTGGLTALTIPVARLADHYAPMTVNGIDTVGVAALLAVYEGSSSPARSRRIARFVDLLVDRFESVRAASAPSSIITLSAHPPGWAAHPAMKTRLEGQAHGPSGQMMGQIK